MNDDLNKIQSLTDKTSREWRLFCKRSMSIGVNMNRSERTTHIKEYLASLEGVSLQELTKRFQDTIHIICEKEGEQALLYESMYLEMCLCREEIIARIIC